MGKKYIYAKRSTDSPFLVRENGFHFLYMYLGAYLKYEKEKDLHNRNFEEYLRKYNVKEAIQNCSCWSYSNAAYCFIRDNLNKAEKSKIASKKHLYSKREVRKLGHYSYKSTPAMPKTACEIETELFNTIFANDAICNAVAKDFCDYLYDAWEKDENKGNYLSDANPNALGVTTNYFIEFINKIINDNYYKYQNLFREFKSNPIYKSIQNGLDERNN